MKFCTSCGSQMEDNANFCPDCGAKEEQATVNQPESNPQPRYNQQPGYSKQPTYNQQSTYNQQPTYNQQLSENFEKKLGGVLALSIVAILFSFLFGIISLVFYFQAKKAVNEQEYAKAVKISRITGIIGIVIGTLVFIINIV